MSHDFTQLDDNRRPLNFTVEETNRNLPEYFQEEYPRLVRFLQDYGEYLVQDSDNVAHEVYHLLESRDISQVDNEYLKFIEDELLLGQSYFEGFVDKRTAAKFSALLYRSKGSQFSIEQFFRMFYGIDPQVVYGRDFLFRVGSSPPEVTARQYQNGNPESPVSTKVTGNFLTLNTNTDPNRKQFFIRTDEWVVYDPSDNVITNYTLSETGQESITLTFTDSSYDGQTLRLQTFIEESTDTGSIIGPESNKFITNDKFYQTLALQIRTALGFFQYRDVYKLFVHPAGMYVEGQTQIVTVATIPISAPDVTLIIPELDVVGVANVFGTTPTAVNELTWLYTNDEGNLFRSRTVNLDLMTDSVATLTPTQLNYWRGGDSDLTLAELDKQYQRLEQFVEYSSPTMDIDRIGAYDSVASIGAVGRGISMDNTLERMDQVINGYWSADSDLYLIQFDSARMASDSDQNNPY
jgi:hypothetical protein